MPNPLMSFIERQTKKAEDQTEKIIVAYGQALRSNSDALSVRDMASRGGANPSVLGDRAVGIHRRIFQEVLSSSGPGPATRKQQRVDIIEQFCVALWMKFIGRSGFDAMIDKLGLRKGPR